MKKKILVGIVMIVMAFSILCTNCVNAASADDWVSQVIDDNETDTNAQGRIGNIIGIILGITKTAALGIAVIMLTYLGIKYMSAAPNEKASIKTQLITFALGGILVFGAATIIQKVMEISQGVFE